MYVAWQLSCVESAFRIASSIIFYGVRDGLENSVYNGFEPVKKEVDPCFFRLDAFTIKYDVLTYEGDSEWENDE
jgi:hypothetical protein